MIPLYYDLHIHSCLSPCGDDDMTPGNIVGMAYVKGLDVIAVTDHNSCKNCPAAIFHGKNYGITVIPGMELCTAEEVHVLCLFPSIEDAMDFDAYVYSHMLPIKNKEKIWGKQQIMDEKDEECGRVENLLISATDISFGQAEQLAASYRGIAIPAHLDKSSTSLISNLGFIPPDSLFTCAEVHDMKKLHNLQKTNPYLHRCTILSSSDAHYLPDINEPSYRIYAKSKSPQHILEALKKIPE